MKDYPRIERQLSENLQLGRRPVAIAFLDSAPPGVSKFIGTEPSGCSFWRIAAAGRTFYTVPSDHYNCAIGSYTHNIPLPPERVQELDQTLGLMTNIGYVRMEEVPAISRLQRTPGVVVYAPLGETPIDPDVVLFCERPARMMLLQEAAIRAGIESEPKFLPRPTCMALPAALYRGIVTSTGCIGNRVYTDIDDGELYLAIAGKDVVRVADQAQTIGAANAQLLEYHRQRRQTLETV